MYALIHCLALSIYRALDEEPELHHNVFIASTRHNTTRERCNAALVLMARVSDITCTRNVLFARKFIRIRYKLPESAAPRVANSLRLIYARRVFARFSDNFLRRGFKRSDGQLYTSTLANYGNPS